MCIYNSPTEDRERALIQKVFPAHRIVDPGTYQDNEEKDARGMEYCLELVENCDSLVFSRILGKVTSGVGKEIEHALNLRKPVFELANDVARPIQEPPSYLSREESRDLYAEWRKRNVSYRTKAHGGFSESSMSRISE
jgi:hypothetical protein